MCIDHPRGARCAPGSDTEGVTERAAHSRSAVRNRTRERAWLALGGVALACVVTLQPAAQAQSPSAPASPAGALVLGCAGAAAADPLATGAWTSAPGLPEPRSEGAAAAIGDRVYVAGGIRMSGTGGDTRVTTLDSIVSLGPGDPAWVGGWALPAPRDHLAMVAWEGHLYAAGGTQADQSVARRSLWRGNPADGSWRQLARMPDLRYGHAMVVVDGILYVVGGTSGRTTDARSVWAYDIAQDAWRTDLALMPTPRDHLAAVAVGGRIVAIGGWHEVDLATVDIYDIATDTWSAGPPMRTPRNALSAALLADGVHVVGGEDLTTLTTLDVHEVLDPTLTTWSCRAGLPLARQAVASAVVDGRWILAGGGPSGPYSSSAQVDIWQVGGATRMAREPSRAAMAGPVEERGLERDEDREGRGPAHRQ